MGGPKERMKMKRKYVELSGKKCLRRSIYYLEIRLLLYNTNSDRTIESVFSIVHIMQVSSIEFWWQENKVVDGSQKLRGCSKVSQGRRDWEKRLMILSWRRSSDDLVAFFPHILLLKGCKPNVLLNTQFPLSLFHLYTAAIYSLGSHLCSNSSLKPMDPKWVDVLLGHINH